jgi:hypothetical protein
MDRPENIDDLLRLRATPPEPDGMQARILALAATQAREGRASARVLRFPLRPWYAELLQVFSGPVRASAFAAVLLFGLMIGLDLGAVPDDAPVDWSNLFASGDSWL